MRKKIGWILVTVAALDYLLSFSGVDISGAIIGTSAAIFFPIVVGLAGLFLIFTGGKKKVAEEIRHYLAESGEDIILESSLSTAYLALTSDSISYHCSFWDDGGWLNRKIFPLFRYHSVGDVSINLSDITSIKKASVGWNKGILLELNDGTKVSFLVEKGQLIPLISKIEELRGAR